MLRIIANHVEHRANHAQKHRVRILLHEQHVAPLFVADFMNKLDKAARIAQIHIRVRLTSMSIAARDQRTLPAFSQRGNFLILIPAPHSIQFKCMDELNIFLQELINMLCLLVESKSIHVPHGMVENYQHVRKRMQPRQQFCDGKAGSFLGEQFKLGEDFLRLLPRQIVNAQVENCFAKGHAPLK